MVSEVIDDRGSNLSSSQNEEEEEECEDVTNMEMNECENKAGVTKDKQKTMGGVLDR